MKQYLDLVRSILETGSWQENRTGIRTITMPGAMLRFDLQEGFPAVTTKKLAFKSAIGEMIGFLRASRSAADFRALGCKVWDANANENAAWLANPYREGVDDLGPEAELLECGHVAPQPVRRFGGRSSASPNGNR